MTTTLVENYPGFSKGIMGPQLMMEMREQARRFGVQFIGGKVTRVRLPQEGNKEIWVGDQKIEAQAVIIATGSQTRWLGLPNEREWVGKGISVCATCDGFFFKNERVALVGGGDTALEEALFLSKFAEKVIVIHRRDQLKASAAMRQRAFAESKIEFVWDTEVKELKGKNKLERLVLKHVKTGEFSEIKVAALFVAIGSDPATSLFKNQLDLDEKGFIVLKRGTESSVKGVFVAGDVADPLYKQAVVSAGSGCRAGLDALRFIEARGSK